MAATSTWPFTGPQHLRKQTDDSELAGLFRDVAEQLSAQEQTICEELLGAQGETVEIGGYYLPDDAKADAAMRPSEALNKIVAAL